MRLALLVLVGCVRHPPITEPSTWLGNSELLVAMRRTECLGTCPAYLISVYRDGRVEYDGHSHVSAEGYAKARLPADRMIELERRVTESMRGLGTRYTEHDCTDHPSATIWYRPRGGPTKQIEHYLGMSKAPQELLDLEATIDLLLDAGRWTGVRVPMVGGC